jgi:flavorubredoxin
MPTRELKDGIHWVGAIDRDRRTFDELIPLPDGTSYNAYRVKGGEKTALIARGVGVDLFNLATTDLGRLAVARVDAGTLVLGSPMVVGGAHPLVANAAYLANLLKPRARYGAIIGSYGWGGSLSPSSPD